MSGFSEKLRLKEQAEEDIYFAQRDRELVEVLRRRRVPASDPDGELANPLPAKIVTGGQTGVDRAALDAALQLGLAIGGWCPQCRRAEDGRIPDRYPLQETPSYAYRERTEWNVRDSDATLIIHRRTIRGGTRLTAEIAARYGRPLFTLDLAGELDLHPVKRWLSESKVRTLNVAGPREGGAPGIYAEAHTLICRLLANHGKPSPARSD